MLLYASTSDDPGEEKIEVNHPAREAQRQLASVIIRPVQLNRLAELIKPENRHHFQTAQREYAEFLIQA